MPVKQIQDKKSVRNFYNRNAARLSWLLAVMLAVIGLALILPPALAELTPGTVAVDDKINVSFSGLRLNRSTNTFDSLATLTNKSNEPINIPVQLAITTISASTVTLANATGIQTNGVPYVNVPVSDGILDPGESVSNIQLNSIIRKKRPLLSNTVFLDFFRRPIIRPSPMPAAIKVFRSALKSR